MECLIFAGQLKAVCGDLVTKMIVDARLLSYLRQTSVIKEQQKLDIQLVNTLLSVVIYLCRKIRNTAAKQHDRVVLETVHRISHTPRFLTECHRGDSFRCFFFVRVCCVIFCHFLLPSFLSSFFESPHSYTHFTSRYL